MEKPVARLIGANGNIYNLVNIAKRALRKAGQTTKGEEMWQRIKAEAKSYEAALDIVEEYVEIE